MPDEALASHVDLRRKIVFLSRTGNGSFTELSTLSIPVIDMLYEEAVEIELILNPNVTR